MACGTTPASTVTVAHFYPYETRAFAYIIADFLTGASLFKLSSPEEVVYSAENSTSELSQWLVMNN